MPFDEFDRFFEKRFRIPESLPAQSPGFNGLQMGFPVSVFPTDTMARNGLRRFRFLISLI